MSRIETREVLADAYTPKQMRERKFLTHAVRVEGRTETPLCRRVRAENLVDAAVMESPGDPPTCPECLRKDPRFNSTPAAKPHPADESELYFGWSPRKARIRRMLRKDG